MKSKQFAVIGIGRFGEALIAELTGMGYEVLAVDIDEERVQDAVDIATHAVQVDSIDEQALKALGIRNFDVAVVAIGSNVQSNILTTIILKEMGVPKVVAKAQNALHGKVLEKIGADLVIFPERDMAIKTARMLVSRNFLEQIALSQDYGIVESFAPQAFIGRSLNQLQLRKKHRLTLLAIRRGKNIIIAPPADEIVLKGDVLVALGDNEGLEYLGNLE